MPLNIKDAETHALARELAAANGETLTKAVHIAIREHLQKVRARGSRGAGWPTASTISQGIVPPCR